MKDLRLTSTNWLHFENKDIIITDPCYIIRAEHHGTKPLTEDDWNACEYGYNMEVLGIKNYLTHDTIYGDWSCMCYRSGNVEEVAKKANEWSKYYFD